MESCAEKERLYDAKMAFERARRKGADVWHDTKNIFMPKGKKEPS